LYVPFIGTLWLATRDLSTEDILVSDTLCQNTGCVLISLHLTRTDDITSSYADN